MRDDLLVPGQQHPGGHRDRLGGGGRHAPHRTDGRRQAFSDSAAKQLEQITSGGAAANAQESTLRASRPGLTGEGADRDGWWVQAGGFCESIGVEVMCSTR
ncbi:hypothetical protein ACWDY4_46445 [Streptomyces olivaceoviridis]